MATKPVEPDIEAMLNELIFQSEQVVMNTKGAFDKRVATRRRIVAYVMALEEAAWRAL